MPLEGVTTEVARTRGPLMTWCVRNATHPKLRLTVAEGLEKQVEVALA